MAPPPTPTPLVNAKGQPIDAEGRRIDGMGRPMEDRVTAWEDLPFPGYPSISIAYPVLDDWVAMFDPRHNRSDASNLESYEDFKQRHQKQITSLLKEIVARKSGKALLGETNLTANTITIFPIDFVSTSSRWIKFHNNAIATTDSAVKSTHPGMYASTSKNKKTKVTTNNIGTGEGANSEIYFTAGRLRPGGPGYNSDEILFHELVHAVRDTQGASTSGFKMGNDYDNAEEFAAVVTTNVYMSEKKQTKMRANHGRGELANPEKFLDSPQVPAPGARGLLSLYRQRLPRLFNALAAISAQDAAFNPFRQLAEETAAATKAHDAKMREFDRRR
jgi:hypothetical protein